MALIPHKVKRKGHKYYEPVEEKWMSGRAVQKYVNYPGKSPNSKKEIEPDEIMKYPERLLKKVYKSEGKLKPYMAFLKLQQFVYTPVRATFI